MDSKKVRTFQVSRMNSRPNSGAPLIDIEAEWRAWEAQQQVFWEHFLGACHVFQGLLKKMTLYHDGISMKCEILNIQKMVHCFFLASQQKLLRSSRKSHFFLPFAVACPTARRLVTSQARVLGMDGLIRRRLAINYRNFGPKQVGNCTEK